ncbi:MAG TPA: oxidoreductase [Verrucomicrobiae bacterium]|jgi:NAD(P)-dependent dehydrogenase (short-subunit alcohol dehydrogenase family)|nr:oxidoreductase [Verrucomicrobiae bacterium]
MKNIWFITGSSRGFGRALTEAVLEAGHCVIATARRPEQLDDLVARYGSQIRPVKLDVTSPTNAEKAVAFAIEAFGRIDVLVNNAGYGFSGAFEEMKPDEFAAQMDTNFWGVVHVTRAALPILRRQGHGHIIQITSIGGRIGVPGLSGYNAAKFAVEGFSESLAQEIKPLGLKLTIVEPGGFRTDWAGNSMAYATPIAAYAPTVGVMRKHMEAHTGHEPGDPRKGAAAILQIANRSMPPLRLPLGNDAMALGRRGYQQSLDELDRWASLTQSTDFDGVTASVPNAAVLEVLGKA